MSDVADDLSLLQAVADGDERSLRLLFERHAPWIAVRLRHRCNDREVVEDVLSDTFVAVWRGARGYRGDGDVAAWVWGIAAKRLVSRLRGRPARSLARAGPRCARRAARRAPRSRCCSASSMAISAAR